MPDATHPITGNAELAVPLLRQSVYSRLAGYEDVNDAERLAVDPAMCHVVGGRAAEADNEAASMSVVRRFETEMLSQRCNLTALMPLSTQWIDKAHQRQPLGELILARTLRSRSKQAHLQGNGTSPR